MLQVQNVTFKRGDRAIFEALDLTIHKGHKVGIVGRNGAGKSTLFELLRERLLPEEGDVLVPRDWRVAALEQDVTPSPRAALDYVIDGDTDLRRVERRIERAEHDDDHDALARAYLAFEDHDGYTATARAGEILGGLGFERRDFDKPHQDFSGGWRIRLNLAQTLMTPSELLLLDEPTNHLDLETTLWLENWVRRYEGTLLMIAHDRDFLDRTAQSIVHLVEAKADNYRGNYSAFERQRAEALHRQEAVHRQQQLEVARISAFVDRFRAKASKAKQVQSRLKALDRMQLVAAVHAESPYQFSFKNPEKISNPTISFDEVELGYAGHPVLADVTLRIHPGDRVGVLGLNGAGKTTLLRALAHDLEPLTGDLRYGMHSGVGYFAQHQLESLQLDETPLAQVIKAEPLTEQQARDYLGGWGFTGDDVAREASTFSGGEKARLVLALIALTKPAVLILDEPTNHLDIEMRQALATALQSYEGALLVVSHDRHLLRQCVDRFWLVAHGRVDDRYEGDLDTYSADAMAETRATDERRGLTKPAPKRARTNVTRLKKEQAVVDKKLDRFTKRLKGIESELVQLATEATSDRYTDLVKEQRSVSANVEELETQWLDLQERIDEAV